MINKYLIEDEISESDDFDSSDESYVEDADSFKLVNKRTKKRNKFSNKGASIRKERPRSRPQRESSDTLDLEGRYMKS